MVCFKIPKRQPIPCPHRQAMGCLYEVLRRVMTLRVPCRPISVFISQFPDPHMPCWSINIEVGSGLLVNPHRPPRLFHSPRLVTVGLSWLVIGLFKYRQGISTSPGHSRKVAMHCGMWPVGIPREFPATDCPLHSPNDRHCLPALPVVRVVQEDCETVYRPPSVMSDSNFQVGPLGCCKEPGYISHILYNF